MTSPSSTSSSDRPIAVEQAGLLARALRSLFIWLVVALPAVVAADRLFALRRTAYDLKVEALLALAPEIDTLILGTSQMLEGVDPHVVGPHAFNMAEGSQDLWYDAAALARFAPRLPRLRTVVWGLSPFSCGYDLASTPRENRLLPLVYDRQLPRRDPRLGALDRVALVSARGDDPIRAWVELFEQLADARDPLPAAVAERGFHVRPPAKEYTADGPLRWSRHEGFAHEIPPEDNLSVVVARTRELQARGVRVIFVLPPLAPTYAGPGPMMREHEACVARLRAETGAGYVSLRDAVPTGRGWFRNSDHVQGEGTRIFSERIRELVSE